MASKLCLILIINFVFGAAIYYAGSEQIVFEFHPSFPEDNFITIQPKIVLRNSTGFSLCLRTMIWNWNSKYIFESANLSLFVDNYKDAFGYLIIGRYGYQFFLEK